MLKDKIKRKQFIFSYLVFVLNGMLALSIGSMMPFISSSRGLNYVFCGTLVSLHSVGNLISSFFAGALAVKLGRKKSILLFNACFAIAYLLILIGGNNWCLVAAFLMSGLARGATSNFCNTAINGIAPGKAAPINGLHAMFSVGAFSFPILLMAITKTNADNWIIACVFMLAMGVLSWLLYFMIPVDEALEAKKPAAKAVEENKGDKTSAESIKAEKKGKSGADGFFKEPIFYLTICTLFFYLCAEQGVIGWLVTYFKDTGLLDSSLSQLMASVQWLMILAGRLTVAWASTKVKKEKLLPIMGVGLVAFYLLLVNAHSTGLIVFGIMGFGFSMAGIYPTTVSFSGKLIQKYPLAWSYILTLASLGSILMPSIIGRIADNAGITAGMRSVAVAVLVDLACIISLVTYVGRKAKSEEA